MDVVNALGRRVVPKINSAQESEYMKKLIRITGSGSVVGESYATGAIRRDPNIAYKAGRGYTK